MDGYIDHLVVDEWDFDLLLSSANPTLKSRIQGSKLESVFLSWLIEASLSEGVHSPLSLAISRTLQTHQPSSLPRNDWRNYRLQHLPIS